MSEELSSSDWPFLTFPVLEAIYKSPQIASDRPVVHIQVVSESPLEVALEVGSPQCEPALTQTPKTPPFHYLIPLHSPYSIVRAQFV